MNALPPTELLKVLSGGVDSGCAVNTKLMNNMATIKASMRRLAEAAGATFIRFGKGGHELHQLRGKLVTIPGSPGDRRALENSAAVILTNDVGRIAGDLDSARVVSAVGSELLKPVGRLWPGTQRPGELWR